MKAQTHWKHVAKLPLVRAEAEHTHTTCRIHAKQKATSWHGVFHGTWGVRHPDHTVIQLVRKFQLFPNSWVPKFPLLLYDLFQQSSKLSLTPTGTHVALCNSSGTSKYLLILANICSYCFVSLLTLSIHFWLLLPCFPDPIGLMIEINNPPVITGLHKDLAASVEAKAKLFQAWLQKTEGIITKFKKTCRCKMPATNCHL